MDKKNKYIEKTSVAKENKQILRSVKHNLYAPGMFEGKVSIAGVEGADKALNLMNNKQITSLLVSNNKKTSQIIGVLHIHTILKSNIS